METSGKVEFITDITGPPRGNQVSKDQSEQHCYLLKDGNYLNMWGLVSKRHLSLLFS